MTERTLVLLKPDAVEQALEARIRREIRRQGLAVTRQKLLRLTPQTVRAHYAHHVDKPFFPGLLAYMTRGPVIAMIVEGDDAVAVIRELAGATDPTKAAPHTLRARFGRKTPEGGVENVVHASEKTEEAEVEIARFFGHEPSWPARLFGRLARLWRRAS
jgi:nucleoside-diphosphate kinase